MKFRKIISTILITIIAGSLFACSAKTIETSGSDSSENINESSVSISESNSGIEEETSGTTLIVVPENAIPDQYEEIISDINIFIEIAFDENFELSESMRNAHYGLLDEVYLMDEDEAFQRICFALLDIDSNGTDELIIACKNSEDPMYEYVGPVHRAGYNILEIYTIVDGEASMVLESWSRNSWYLNSNLEFINSGSSGAAYHELNIYSEISDVSNLTPSLKYYSELNPEGTAVDFYLETNGNEAEYIASDDEGWEYVDSIMEEYTSSMCQLDLVPVNAPRV